MDNTSTCGAAPYDGTPEELQEAIDWAHSVQVRQAEMVMGAYARDRIPGDKDPDFQDKLACLAMDAGIEEAVVRAAIYRASPEKISPMDEPEVRSNANVILDQLVETMSKVGMGTGGRKLIVSSLASGQVNALCAVNSWDDKHYHIFVDADLIIFCNTMAKIYAECLTVGNAVDGTVGLNTWAAEQHARSGGLAQKIVDLFGSAVLKGTVRASKPWLPKPDQLPWAQGLAHMLVMFPIAHELGHLHLGHLDSEDTQTAIVEGFDDVEAQVFSRQAEFDADMVGAIVATETAKRLGFRNAVTVLAPYIFLKSIEILDTCYEMFTDQKTAMSFTHPSASERVAKMREVIAMHMELRNSSAPLPEMLRMVDKISHWILFWAVLSLEKAKNAGATPRKRVSLRVAEVGERPQILGMVPVLEPGD